MHHWMRCRQLRRTLRHCIPREIFNKWRSKDNTSQDVLRPWLRLTDRAIGFALRLLHMFAMMTKRSTMSLPSPKVMLLLMKASMAYVVASNIFCPRALPKHAPTSDVTDLVEITLLNTIVSSRLVRLCNMMHCCVAVLRGNLTILRTSPFKWHYRTFPQELKLKLCVSKLSAVEHLDLMLSLLRCYKA